MTKKELEERIEELKEELEEQLDDIVNQLEDLEMPNSIKDINNFIWRLKLDNLYSSEIENFINEYLRFYN